MPKDLNRFFGLRPQNDSNKGLLQQFQLITRALNQAARELVLAQSSDWAFIMKTGTMVPYAQRRTKLHINRFTRLYHEILNGNIDDHWLKQVEARDNIFRDINTAGFYLPKTEAPKVKMDSRKVAAKAAERELTHVN